MYSLVPVFLAVFLLEASQNTIHEFSSTADSNVPTVCRIQSIDAGGYRYNTHWYQPANAFDGNYGTNWLGPKPGSKDAWIKATFNQNCPVTRIRLWDRMSTNHNPSRLRVSFSNGEEKIVSFPVSYTQGRTPLNLTFDGILSRYVRIDILANYTDPAASAMNEIEIFIRDRDGVEKQIKYQGKEVHALLQRQEESRNRIEETQSHIRQLRAAFDPQATKRYWNKVQENKTDRTVTFSMAPWSLTWSLITGVGCSASIKGQQYADAEFGNLIIMTKEGKRFYQHLSTDGSFVTEDSKFTFMLRGYFTPSSGDGDSLGTRVDCVIKIHKMSGLVEIRYFPRSPVVGISRVHIQNTLGSGSHDHDLTYRYGYYPGVMTVASPKAGIQVHLIDWNRNYFETEAEPELLVRRDQNGHRSIEVVLAESAGTDYFTVDSTEQWNYAFSLLPVRDQAVFEPIWCHPWFGMPWSESSFGQADRDYIKRYSRRWGQTYFIIGSQWPNRITQRPSELKQFIDTVHAYDCKVMVYMDLRWNNPDRVCYEGDLTYAQMRDARMRHHLDNGLSVGSPAWRKVLLDWYHRMFTEYEIDAIYIDSINEDNDLPDPGRGNILGIDAFLSDLRLLVDEGTREKKIVLHMLGQDATSHVALGDYMLPGEHMATSNVQRIRGLDLQYNPYLYGCQHIAYSAKSYDQSHPVIINQLLRYPLSPWLSTYLTGPEWALGINEPDESLEAYHKYRKPVVEFCRDGTADVHHYLDPDFDRKMQITGDSVDPVLYLREGQFLLVLTQNESYGKECDIRISLDLLGTSSSMLRVKDSVTGDSMDATIHDGSPIISDIVLSEMPRVIVGSY